MSWTRSNSPTPRLQRPQRPVAERQRLGERAGRELGQLEEVLARLDLPVGREATRVVVVEHVEAGQLGERDPLVEHRVRLAAEHLDVVAEVDERLGEVAGVDALAADVGLARGRSGRRSAAARSGSVGAGADMAGNAIGRRLPAGSRPFRCSRPVRACGDAGGRATGHRRPPVTVAGEEVGPHRARAVRAASASPTPTTRPIARQARRQALAPAGVRRRRRRDEPLGGRRRRRAARRQPVHAVRRHVRRPPAELDRRRPPGARRAARRARRRRAARASAPPSRPVASAPRCRSASPTTARSP